MATILVLGYRQGLDEAIRRRGLTPLFVVERVKRQLAGRDYARVASVEDAQEVLRTVLARGIDEVCAVVTGHEEAVFITALLRAHFDAPGDRDFARTLRFRDKFLQKRALPSSVPRARCEYVTVESSYADLAGRLGQRFVVKPANGFGSARTCVVSSQAELDAYWGGCPARSDTCCVGESFVDGSEIHVDGLWRDGHIAWSCLSTYLNAPMRCNDGGILSDVQVSREREPELCAAAEALTEQVMSALHAPDTVFHLEAFHCASGEHAGRLVFGECAIRLGGGMVPESVALTYGVDLYDTVLSLALGEPFDLAAQARRPEHYYAYVYLRRVAGVNVTEDDFRRAFREHLYEIDYPADSDAPRGAYGRVGHMLVRHADSERLKEIVANVVAFNETGKLPGPVLDSRLS